MKKRVGFVGCYSHDVILMLARLLCYMDKTVLIRDRNKRRTLQVSVPIPEGLCVSKATVEYNGFFYTRKSPGEEEEEQYEIELIDFGMNGNQEDFAECTEIIIVTDMLLHHIRQLSELPLPETKIGACIMRDAFEDICNGEAEVRSFLQRIPLKYRFYLAPDFRDVKNRYVCETRYEYQVSQASPEMQEALYRLIRRLYPEVTKKELRRRVKRRERRRYR